MSYFSNAMLVFGFLSGTKEREEIFNKLPEEGNAIYEKYGVSYYSVSDNGEEKVLEVDGTCVTTRSNIVTTPIPQKSIQSTEEYKKKFEAFFKELDIDTNLEPKWLLMGWMD